MRRRIIDLTFPVHAGMTVFPAPWHPQVEVTVMGRHGFENRETRQLLIGSHTGTHCDAARHFVPGGGTVDELPLDVLTGPAAVADLSGQAKTTAAFTAADLKRRLPAKCSRVLLRYDWSDRWGSPDYYRGYPYLTPDAADWLIDQGVVLLGMDTPSPDHPDHGRNHATDSPIHKQLLAAGVVLVEYLCNLRAVRGPTVDFYALPLKLKGGDGAPARCIAIENDPA